MAEPAPTPPTSGITGSVAIWPIEPVSRVGGGPTSRPIAVAIVVSDRAGTVVARTSSGADGRFALDVPPGHYTVQGIHDIGGPGMLMRPVRVVVESGAHAEVTLILDTGIRMPQRRPDLDV